ncbi:MAG: hypothetical protein P8181_12455, partial [bacterium]
LCMHDSPAGFTWGNTASSVVVEIDPESPATSPYWCCYQPPCSGAYLLHTLDGGVPEAVGAPGTAGLRSQSPVDVPPDAFRADSMWWRMYRILGAISESPVDRRDLARSLFDPVEERCLANVASCLAGPVSERGGTMRECAAVQMSEIERVLLDLEQRFSVGDN